MKILSFFLLFFANSLYAQDQCHCCTIDHEVFDFWIGKWTVRDTLGNVLGNNVIVKDQNNCMLKESWIASNGSTGTSTNYFNPTDSTWNQLWIDDHGTILKLIGKSSTDQMVLKSALVTTSKATYYNQITWSLLADGRVSQVWNLYSPEHKLIFQAFYGLYAKD